MVPGRRIVIPSALLCSKSASLSVEKGLGNARAILNQTGADNVGIYEIEPRSERKVVWADHVDGFGHLLETNTLAYPCAAIDRIGAPSPPCRPRHGRPGRCTPPDLSHSAPPPHWGSTQAPPASAQCNIPNFTIKDLVAQEQVLQNSYIPLNPFPKFLKVASQRGSDC